VGVPTKGKYTAAISLDMGPYAKIDKKGGVLKDVKKVTF